MSWVSFAVIGWQSSAFTSWNWSWGGSEEILQHVGFHVMAMCCRMCHTGWKWVRKGDITWYYSKAEAPDIHQHWQLLNLKNLEVSRLEGNKETLADQSQPSRHPFTTADWHIVLWSLCEQGLISKTGVRPAGKCLWNYQRGARSMSACKHTNVSSRPNFIFWASLISIQYSIFLPGWSHIYYLACRLFLYALCFSLRG